MEREYLTVDELASRISFDAETIRRWLRVGDLRGYKFGRPWRVKIKDYEKFISERAM